MLLSVWNNLWTYSIIAGLSCVRGLSVNVLSNRVGRAFCPCDEACFSVLLHSLRVDAQPWFLWLPLVSCVIELRLCPSCQLVFYSNQHQRLFIIHFWSMVETISLVTSGKLLQLSLMEYIVRSLFEKDSVDVLFLWAMSGKLYMECIDNKLLCTDFLPLRSCEFRWLISF